MRCNSEIAMSVRELDVFDLHYALFLYYPVKALYVSG
jgi:hypothetical protein